MQRKEKKRKEKKDLSVKTKDGRAFMQKSDFKKAETFNQITLIKGKVKISFSNLIFVNNLISFVHFNICKV